MNPDSLVLAVAGLLFIALFCAGAFVLHRTVDVQERVRPAAVRERRSIRSVVQKSAGLFRPLGGLIPRSPAEMSRQERRIAQAGFRRPDSAILFHGLQLGFALALLVAAAGTGYFRHHPFLVLTSCALAGALLPDILLSRMIAARKNRVQLALPDALDLTVICVEAGLGLDQALLRIGREILVAHPDLSDELRLTNLEMNLGRSRADALRNLGARTGVDDLKSLCAVLIQTDRFGTSIGETLRVYSDSLRTKRRQRAEERAAKIAVKMIPPLVLFIFPAMFVVIVGPAVIAIARDLLPTLTAK
jgi:tight adherence protein C